MVRHAESGTNISSKNHSKSYISTNNYLSTSFHKDLKTLNNSLSYNRFLTTNVDYSRSRRSISPAFNMNSNKNYF